MTKFNEPISPEALDKATEVVPVTEPAVRVIVPEPEALIVSAVPETLAPNTMLPFVPVASNASVLEAVIVLDIVIEPAPPAVSVKLNIAPVDAPPIVTALESET